MRNPLKLNIPKELEVYRNQLESSIKPLVTISTTKKTTTIFQSKFAGTPYFPKALEYPKDSNDRPMKLLAQLNFEEVPQMINMPKQGILQFFITADDDVMGINFEEPTNQQDFKILYHEQVEKDPSLLVTDFSFLEDLDTEYFPIENELSLTFDAKFEPVSFEDFKRDELLGFEMDFSTPIAEGENEKDPWEVYSEAFSGEGHKIGGYPFFYTRRPEG